MFWPNKINNNVCKAFIFENLFHGHINGAHPAPVHPAEGHQVDPRVHDSNAELYTNTIGRLNGFINSNIGCLQVHGFIDSQPIAVENR